MRKSGRKLLLAILMFAIAAMCAAFAACGGKGNDAKPAIRVEKSIEVTVNGTTQLNASVVVGKDKKEGGEFAYTSADPAVASVSQDGLVRGNKVGTTTVTVTCVFEEKNLTAQVAVTVREQGSRPVLDPEIDAGFVRIRLAVGESDKQISPVVVDGDNVLTGGEFTFTSADNAVATVSETGVVHAVKKGATTVTVSGTYEGTALESVVLPVEIYEVMTVDTGIDNNALVLYSGAGRDRERPFATTATVTPTVTLSGQTISDATISVTAENNGVVSVTEQTITALAAGEAKVTVTATSPSGTEESAVISVTVAKPYCTLDFNAKPVIDLEKGTDFTVFDVSEDVLGIKIGEDDVTYTIEEGTLDITGGAAVGERRMRIETESELIYADVVVATMTIGSVADLKTFADRYRDYNDAAKTPERPYVALTANIDMPAADKGYLESRTSNGDGKGWRGTLDGQGHTINNLSLAHGFMGQVDKAGVIKNLAVTNMTKNNSPTGLVAQNFGGTLENCYFQGTMPGAQSDGWYRAFCSNVTADAVIKNVVLNVTERPADNKSAILSVADGAVVEDLYVLVAGGNGKLTDSANYNKATNGGVYADAYAFRGKLASLQDKFGAGYWDTTDTLIFKSAMNYFAKDTETGKTLTANSDLFAGSSATLTANFTVKNWEIADEADGVTLANNVVSASEQAAAGTSVTVRATGFDKVFGSLYSVDVTLTVKTAEQVTIEGKYITGGNRTGDTLTLDLTEQNITEIVSVSFDGNEVTAYTFTDKKITVDLSAIGNADDMLTIACKDANQNPYAVRKALEKVDYAIGNAKELTELALAIKATNSKALMIENNKKRALSTANYIEVVLTDDIDYEGKDFTALTGKVEFVGSFDGRGHTVYNMHGTDSLFPSFNGTSAKHTVFKNVAFANAVVNCTNKPYISTANWGTGAYFAYMANKSLITDVYLEVTVNNCADKQFGMFRSTVQVSSNYSLYGNIVAIVDYVDSFPEANSGPATMVTISQSNGFINCYVVCNKEPTGTYNDSAPAPREDGCFIGTDTSKGNGIQVYRYTSVQNLLTALDGKLPVLPEYTKPTKPTAPTDPGEEGTEEEKAAYQELLTQYNKDLEKYNADLAAYNAVMASENNRLEKAYNHMKQNADGFNADIWQFVEKGGAKTALTFKSWAGLATHTPTISTPYTDGLIATGTPIALKAAYVTEWIVEGLTADKYTIADGYLTVDGSVAANTVFTVTAKFVDAYGASHTDSKQFTVSKEAKTVTLSEIIYGKNRGNAEIEIGENETVVEFTINGDTVQYSVDGNTLKIGEATLKKLAVNTHYTVKIVTYSDTHITTYNASLSAWDFAIGTVDEWKAFEKAKDDNHSASTPLYAALTADLDFGGAYTPPRKDSDSWYSLDGKGHTIQNVTVAGSHSFLGDVRGTASARAYIRNVIFKNITQKSGHGGLLCLDAEYVDFENLYIEGTVETTDSTLVAGIVGRDVNWSGAQNFAFKNIVANVTFSQTNSFNAVVAGSSMTLQNVYAITATSNGNLGGAASDSAALYTTAEAFAAANVTLGDAWKIDGSGEKIVVTLCGVTVLEIDKPAA